MRNSRQWPQLCWQKRSRLTLCLEKGELFEANRFVLDDRKT
ncbi:hypothetical protein CLOSTMETH_02080 [[Clostridium] methylpentosum DSM 5476]|uniref:Uncharacterized protein n=1 Tax=[Clostridium] methylpentosum DSM 5476 TaxID=537013 RepID=C0EE01_9FIRM|nr:hypothetical protein CLOSTMETH_02080 [[Clostridium] methylpentosum DSM 5476]